MSISTTDGRVEKLIASMTGDFIGRPVPDIAAIYDGLEFADQDIRDALLNGGDREFRAEFLHELFMNEKCAFRKYCGDPKIGRYAEGYLECILNIYEGYKKNPSENKARDLNWLAEQAAEMVTHGIETAK